MEEIKTLVDFVQGIGFVGLLIILAIPKTRKFLGFNGNGDHKSGEIDTQNADIAKILESQQLLRAHYNDETTGLLSEIRDGIKDLVMTHANYEKVGIKTRDCNNKT